MSTQEMMTSDRAERTASLPLRSNTYSASWRLLRWRPQGGAAVMDDAQDFLSRVIICHTR